MSKTVGKIVTIYGEGGIGKTTIAAQAVKENDGIIKFELASEDGYEEPEMTRNVLETDYATTKTAFTGKFATV